MVEGGSKENYSKGYVNILYFLSTILYLPVHVFVLILFSFIFFLLQVFTWVGLWKSHPILCIPLILMSHIRSPSALTGNQGVSCIADRKSKSWSFFVENNGVGKFLWKLFAVHCLWCVNWGIHSFIYLE